MLQSVVVNSNFWAFHVKLLFFYLVIYVMVIVITFRLDANWHCCQVQFNSGLKGFSITLVEEFLFVEAKLFLCDTIEIVRVHSRESIIH